LGEESVAENQERRKTILVVDDFPDWRVTLRGILEDEGLNCICASTASDAIQIAVAERPDLVLTDVRFDESDEDNAAGILILSELKRKEVTKRIPVIVFTGYASVGLVRDAFALGASAVVEKSDVGSSLIEAVQRALLNAELGIL
jgi:CheY-like chemotaxis protein